MTTTTTDLGGDLRAAIERIEGVTLDDRPGGYYIVRAGGKTIGYVNGRQRRFRVEAPRRDPKRRTLVVTKAGQIPRAVKLVEPFAPKE